MVRGQRAGKEEGEKGMGVVGSQGGRRIGERWRSTKDMGDRGKEENVRVRKHRCITDEA